MDVNNQNLLQLLKELNQESKLQEETGQVYTILKEDKREFPLFVRVYEQGDLLQLIAFFPLQMEKKVIPDMARLLHLLNKELDLPGFGMDEMGGVAFFRTMLPIPHKKLDKKQFELAFQSVKMACKTFSPTIDAVAMGATTVDSLIRKAQDAMAKSKKPS